MLRAVGATERRSAGEAYSQFTYSHYPSRRPAVHTRNGADTPRRALSCPGGPDVSSGEGVLSVRLGSRNKQHPPLRLRKPQRSRLTCVTCPLRASWGPNMLCSHSRTCVKGAVPVSRAVGAGGCAQVDTGGVCHFCSQFISQSWWCGLAQLQRRMGGTSHTAVCLGWGRVSNSWGLVPLLSNAGKPSWHSLLHPDWARPW